MLLCELHCEVLHPTRGPLDTCFEPSIGSDDEAIAQTESNVASLVVVDELAHAALRYLLCH
jgi:hypothetical protein